MTPEQQERLRHLPAIGQLLERESVRGWLAVHPRAVVVEALQAAVDEMRARLLKGDAAGAALEPGVLARAQEHLVARTRRALRRTINATGVVLHTGLGRAPLCAAALDAVVACARGYSNLEFDLASGARGRRSDHVTALLTALTGAEAATVVNNNAAATLLILNTVARGAEVVVSRGQLVEIGGSYRLPDVMAASGAILREVGTTNRTRLADYERALGDNSAALLRVHTSNYKIVGFAESAALAELVALGRRYGKTVIDDLGSGALVDLAAHGLADEPQVRASVAAGADLVCFSGDKLLGGPQAGIIVGRRDLVTRIEANPLMRTYRVGKLTLAALEATLRLYRDEAQALAAIPVLAMLTCDRRTLTARAQRLRRQLRRALPDEDFAIVQEASVAGGGSLPGCDLASPCLAWTPKTMTLDEAQQRLRQADPPVVARTSKARILLDPRTIQDQDIPELTQAITNAVNRP